MSDKYQPSQFEKKWIETWEKERVIDFDPNSKKQKYYVLVELPYTSGDLHIGHWFAFSIPDILARYKKMKGFNVLFPNGYDAFGLPAENAAIKRNIHPKDWTMKNIDTMNAQFKTMGTVIDWRYTATSCLPEYYRWNQWIFLKLYEKGLAYRGKILSNWCEHDQTVLANEHVESGKCWRCGNVVVQKEVEQWFIKITAYADRLIWPEKPTVDWPVAVRVGQNNWIGKSQGMLIDFGDIKVYTTRPETADGVSFIVLAPEHKFVALLLSSKFKDQNSKLKEIREYVKYANKKTELERKENKEKTGVFTGSYVINPVTNKKIPVWVSDYVLYGYGTGAIMAVPAEDERDREFAKKFNLEIIPTSLKAEPKGIKQSQYHIHDWSISRQRYWGTPVPMIHCNKCGTVPVPEKDLPIELPYDVDFTPRGKPPLASNEKWLNVKCPKCGGDAKRDAETLDTFFDSSWYYYRYLSPKYDQGPFDTKVIDKLMPVDIYFGGAEHTLGHTLYARFFTKFFKDIGLVKFDEFAKKRFQHGVILGPDGARMSKSKGNVINPDDVVKEYGIDTVRLYLSFIMPYESTGPWSVTTIAGVHRFLIRVWNLFQGYKDIVGADRDPPETKGESQHLILKLNKTIEKIGNDIEAIKPNTAVAAMMEFLNQWEKANTLSVENAKKFLKILAPFAPFITEEIWQSVFEEKQSIHLSDWPKIEEMETGDVEITIPVQVNGKVRGTIKVQSSTLRLHSGQECKVQNYVVEKALKDENIAKYLEGKKYKVIYVEGKILSFVW